MLLLFPQQKNILFRKHHFNRFIQMYREIFSHFRKYTPTKCFECKMNELGKRKAPENALLIDVLL